MAILSPKKATICSDSASLPSWGGLEHFEIRRLGAGGIFHIPRRSVREILFIVDGSGLQRSTGTTHPFRMNSVIEWRGERCRIETKEDSTVVTVGGAWEEPSGGCGVFALDRAVVPRNAGDPWSCERNTDFDRHYHDCDEYWIITSGSAVTVLADETMRVREGMCIATPAGVHHDIPMVYEPLGGIYLETELTGNRRIGHLWTHAHGKPQTD